jgi:hypothetical protein
MFQRSAVFSIRVICLSIWYTSSLMMEKEEIAEILVNVVLKANVSEICCLQHQGYLSVNMEHIKPDNGDRANTWNI